MNHSESFRRYVRTILSGLLVAVLFAYFSSPRLLVETNSNWLPRHSSELDSFAETITARRAASVSLAVNGADSTASNRELEERLSSDSLFAWSVAGFPFDAIHIQSREAEVRYHTSVFALLLNALALVAIIGGTVGFAYFCDLPSRGRSRFVVAWALFLCVFVAGSGWQIAIANVQADELKRYGHVTERESVRHPLFRMLPDSVRIAWTHYYSFLQKASVEHVSGDMIHKTCLADHPELHVVELSGKLSATLHNDLRKLPFLHTLFYDRLTSPEALQILTRSLPSLHSLNAHIATKRLTLKTEPKTIGRSSLAIDFHLMPELRHLSLLGIDLSDFAPDAFSVPRLKTMSIELVENQSFPLSIRDQRDLEVLNVASTSRTNACLSIELVNLPSLVSVGTPGFRPVDLKIDRTPRLQMISANTGAEDIFTFNASDNPPWIRSLEIDSAASLPAIAAIVDSPEQWKVEDCPNLRTLLIKQPSPQWQSFLGMSQETGDLSVIWDWMKGPLALNQVSFNGVDMRNVDLSAWKEMKFLESIALKRCATNAGQFRQLTELERLNRIVAPDVVIDSATADELLASRNDWVELSVDWSRLSSVRIADQSKLVAAFDQKGLSAREIELENLPRFNAALVIQGDATHLKLKHLPLLQSVVVNGKMSQDAELKGLLSLRKFGVRESTLSEDHVRFLQSATRLQSLYLPRCDVPRELITGLSKWRYLDTVDLSHLRVRVDHDGHRDSRTLADEDMVNLPQMRSLMVLNVDGSDIGIETLQRLKACSDLQAISLRNCLLSGDQLLPLAVSRSLLELRVSKSTVVPEELLENVEIGRGLESSHTFVFNQNVRSGPIAERRWRHGEDAAGRKSFASAAGDRPASLMQRRWFGPVETGQSDSRTDLSDERPLPRRRWKRRFGYPSSDS